MNQVTPFLMIDDLPQIPDLIVVITRFLVDHPEGVSVELYETQGHTVLHLRTDPRDIGQIVGKRGRTALSLRNILYAAGTKLKHRFAPVIVDESSVS
jgi:predicted RNA-binding protein YlqC (UPF0109 family)